MILLITLLTSLVAYATETEFTATQWIEKGDEFQTSKDFTSAIFAYNQAINLDPQIEKAYTQQGKAYLFTEQYELAVSDFTKSIEMEPQNGDLYWLRGLAYAGKGQHQLAINEYNNALRINPKMYMSYWNLALSYERLGANYLAIQAYQSFVQYAPPDYPNVEIAKKRLEVLQSVDKTRVETAGKSLGSIKDIKTTKYIFDFLKKDYLSLNVDKPRWKIGFQQEANYGVITELVSGNETVESWTELITVKFLKKQRNLTPQQYASFLEQNIRNAYGNNVQSDILRSSDSDIVLEFKVSGQPGVPDEHTIMRIFKGNVSYGFVSYAAKPYMTPEMRELSLSIIEGVKYSDYLP